MGREVLKRVEKDEVNCAFHDMRRVVSDLEKLVGGTAQAADSFDLLRHVDYVDFRDAFDSLVANRRATQKKALKPAFAKTTKTTKAAKAEAKARADAEARAELLDGTTRGRRLELHGIESLVGSDDAAIASHGQPRRRLVRKALLLLLLLL